MTRLQTKFETLPGIVIHKNVFKKRNHKTNKFFFYLFFFFYLGMTGNQEHEFECFMTISLYDNYFKKEKCRKIWFSGNTQVAWAYAGRRNNVLLKIFIHKNHAKNRND